MVTGKSFCYFREFNVIFGNVESFAFKSLDTYQFCLKVSRKFESSVTERSCDLLVNNWRRLASRRRSLPADRFEL